MKALVRQLGFLSLVISTCLFSAFAHADDAVLQKIKRTDTLTIGFRETAAPFSVLAQNGKPEGYSVDLCKKIAANLQTALKLPKLTVNYVSVGPQTRIPLLANGTIDLECETAVNTLARQQQVDFSYPIALAEGRMLVRRDSGIKNFSDLNGKIIALANGTTADHYVHEAMAKQKISARILNVRDNAEGFLAVSSQRADTFINDAVLLGSVLKTASNPHDFLVVGQPMSFEQVAIMVAKNNSGLLAVVNATIARSLADGSMQQLYNRWIAPYGVPITGALATLFKIEAVEE